MAKILAIIYPLILLTLFSLLFFFDLGKPVVFDFDESAFAEVSREMLLENQWILPTLNGESFFEKPPLLYWAQMLGYKFFGVTAFSVRIINAICGIATVMILFFGSRSALGNRTAFNGSLILGSSILFVFLSRIAMPDMLFTMFSILCLVLCWHGIERAADDKGGSFLLWFACLASGLAILSKGTIGVLFPLAAIVLYLLSLRQIGLLFKMHLLLPGAAVVLFVGYFWYLMLGVFHPEGFGFVKNLLLEQNRALFLLPVAGYSEPFIYALIILLIGFIPWISYLPIAILHASIWKNDSAASRFLRLFCFFSALVLLFFFFSGTKSPNDLLPFLPGTALITATLFNRVEIRFPFFWHLSSWVSASLFFILGAVFIATPLVIPYLPDLLGNNAQKVPVLAEPIFLGYVPWLAAALFISSAILIIRATRKNSIRQIFEALLLCSFIASSTLFLLVVPLYERLMNRPLVNIAAQAAEHTTPDDKIITHQIGNRSSVMFTARRLIIDSQSDDFQQLSALFSRPDVSIGITTNHHYSQLLNHSIPVTERAREGGFVLFQMTATEQSSNQ